MKPRVYSDADGCWLEFRSGAVMDTDSSEASDRAYAAAGLYALEPPKPATEAATIPT